MKPHCDICGTYLPGNLNKVGEHCFFYIDGESLHVCELCHDECNNDKCQININDKKFFSEIKQNAA